MHESLVEVPGAADAFRDRFKLGAAEIVGIKLGRDVVSAAGAVWHRIRRSAVRVVFCHRTILSGLSQQAELHNLNLVGCC